MNKFFAIATFIGFSISAKAGSGELRFICVNSQLNRLVEVNHRIDRISHLIGYDDVTIYLSVYGDGQNKESLFNSEYDHSYDQNFYVQYTNPNASFFGIPINIELASLKFYSRYPVGRSVSKRVAKANIVRANEHETVAQSLTLTYRDGTKETLSQCSKDVPQLSRD